MRPESQNQPDALERLQARLLTAIREPISDPGRKRTPLAGDGPGASAEALAAAEEYIAPGHLDEDGKPIVPPAERLDLYHRQYWFRVLNFLRSELPGLRLLLGDEAFWAMIEAWHLDCPSRGFTMRYLTRSLADWLDSHPQHCGGRPRAAVDCARLEHALREVFQDASRPPLTLEAIAALDPARSLPLQPALRLLAVRAPVDLLRRQPRPKALPAALEKADAKQPDRFLAISRRGGTRHIEVLDRPAWELLHRLQEGEPLSGALDTVDFPTNSNPTALVQGWFRRWASLGYVAAPEPASATDSKSK